MRKTHIIAEIAWGHDGSIEQALKLLNSASDAGADSISVHITDLNNYMVRHYGNGKGRVSSGREELDVFKYLEKINLTNDDWMIFKKEADKLKIKICVMPNDVQSLLFSEKCLDPDYYVVSAACFVENEFLKEVASYNRKTLFRIGGALLGEIETAINIFRESGNNQIVLLHGFQNYPTKLEETNISQLKVLRELFDVEVGLADHIDGSDPLAKIIPILSVCYDANYIEKHITLDREKKSEDFESALDPIQFKEFVHNVRSAETAAGKSSFDKLSEATIRYRNISRKRIVANDFIEKGDIITKERLVFKRSDVGLQPDQINIILGRTTKTSIQKDESITLDKLK